MKVAVVGSGVSGLAATWLLNEFSEHEVHLFEADERAGGHANTVTFELPQTDDQKLKPVDVDTGFIVFNPSTYPNFLRFLSLYPNLKAAVAPTEMTFSVSRDGGAYEWAGKSLRSFFTNLSRILDKNTWRLLYDILRFNACARRLVMKHDKDDAEEDLSSIGEYLKGEGYSDIFRDNYLIPMTAAIWSTPADKCALDFPAKTLIQFLANHHLLQLLGKPSWLTLRGGSQIYVKQILSSLPSPQLHLGTAVQSVVDSTCYARQVQLCLSTGEMALFERVILACHSDDAQRITKGLNVGNTTDMALSKTLGAFKWTRNEAVLHSDTKLMPRSRLAWSCWNYLTYSTSAEAKEKQEKVSLTYWMNALQHISEEEHGPIFVTLNPPFEPDADKVVGRYQYDHPVIDAQAIRAQRAMPAFQHESVLYAGAWLGYGFHEDGFTSGLRAALDVGGNIQLPFDIREADRKPQPVLVAKVFDILEYSGARKVLGVILGYTLDAIVASVPVVVRCIEKLKRRLEHP